MPPDRKDRDGPIAILAVGDIIHHIDGVWEVLGIKPEHLGNGRERYFYTLQHVEDCNGNEIERGRKIWGDQTDLTRFFTGGDGLRTTARWGDGKNTNR